MLVILPPSETKRDGGAEGSSLDLTALAFPSLNPQRTAALAALKKLSRSDEESTAALGLGPKQRFEIDRNRALHNSPTMIAMDRFTGVLFEGLAPESLNADARDWLARNVVVHSALFGLVGAGDPIPAYRLSHDSRLPGVALRKHWAPAISAALAKHSGLVLDLRSEAYANLGPAPAGAHYLRVVTEGPNGQKRALNHFNKKGKGEFVRALAQSGVDHVDVAGLIEWAGSRDIQLAVGKPGEIELTV